jgi:hypothetical protein
MFGAVPLKVLLLEAVALVLAVLLLPGLGRAAEGPLTAQQPDATHKAIATSAEKAKTDDDKRVLFDFCDAAFSKNSLAEASRNRP